MIAKVGMTVGLSTVIAVIRRNVFSGGSHIVTKSVASKRRRLPAHGYLAPVFPIQVCAGGRKRKIEDIVHTASTLPETSRSPRSYRWITMRCEWTGPSSVESRT